MVLLTAVCAGRGGADEYVDGSVERMNGEDLGRLVWVYAALGYRPSKGSLLGRMGARAIQQADHIRTENAGYIIWGMALLGQGSHPALAQLIKIVETGCGAPLPRPARLTAPAAAPLRPLHAPKDATPSGASPPALT